MDGNNYQHINLQQMQIFLSACETENFTKTAEDLYFSTGMISKKISALEASLGVRLFIREKNRVKLTDSGKMLYNEWSSIYNNLIFSIKKVSHTSSAGSVPITFGLSELVNIDRYFVPLIASYKKGDSSALFSVSLKLDFDLLDRLADGTYDVVFLPKFFEPVIEESGKFNYFLAVFSPLYAAMKSENALSKKELISIADLKDQQFLLRDPEDDPYYHKYLFGLCAQEGFVPKTRSYIDDVLNIYDVFLNMDENSVLISDNCFHGFTSKAVEFREIENTESGLLMVWRKDSDRTISQFAEFAKNFYKNQKTV